MHSIVQEFATAHTPESLAALLAGEPGLVLLRSGRTEGRNSCLSFVTARPMVTLKSWGARCELPELGQVRDSNPWRVMEELMEQFEIEEDHTFPLGGCFGYWGYDLKNFVEPGLPKTALNDLGLPDCHVGFYNSLVVFDHQLSKTWIISTGMDLSGKHDPEKAIADVNFWQDCLRNAPGSKQSTPAAQSPTSQFPQSSLTRTGFISRVKRAQEYIQAGDIYQVNLSHRLSSPWNGSGWDFFCQLSTSSPAPFSAFIDCGTFQLCSSSPELFLRMDKRKILTQPIKGTRARGADPAHDDHLAGELRSSAKENAELVMITDLLRNDLGKVCDYGSVKVPELIRLERFSHVQHLVSTVEGRLKAHQSHLSALESCFPGGSITGAPKIRAMELIDELEPITRGPYTGAIGYLGFNRQSQLSIAIRTAICKDNTVHFNVGAGIVADSKPEAEYEETMAKAAGFLSALNAKEAAPKIAFVSGNWVTEDQAVVSVADRGFLYGDALFETLRIEKGVPQFWLPHLDRLQRGLVFLKIKMPYSQEHLFRLATELIQKNQMRSGVLRLTISRGVGMRGYSPKNANQPSVIMTLHPSPTLDQLNPKQWNLITSSIRVQKHDPLADFKHASKLPQIIARAEADEVSADEALLLNNEGELAEGTASNLFWVKNDAVFTPALECGVLPGITRARILELCRQNGIEAHETIAKPEVLLDSDGVFMSLSTLGITEVVSIDKISLARSQWVQKFHALIETVEKE